MGQNPNSMRHIWSLTILTLALTTSIAQNISTAEDREALFDYIYQKTLQREAFSEIKEQRLGVDPRQAMLKVKSEIINAKNDIELYYALQKLSAARADRHLSIDPVDGGLQVPKGDNLIAPIRFHPDYSEVGNYFLFVADIGKNLNLNEKLMPVVGDKLLQVNGEDVRNYLDKVKAYTRHSNMENFWRRAAYSLSDKNYRLPPWFYKDKLALLLERKNGKQYRIELPYQQEVEWTHGRVFNKYPGYKLAWKKESFHLYVPTDPNNKNLLLWWYGFRRDLQEATDYLIEYAENNNMLDFNIIIDAMDSRGGSQGAYALARLSPHSFKTTGGNLKLSDITDDFINNYTQRYVNRQHAMDGSGREAEDDGSWVMEWLHGPVLKGLAAGQEYSNNAPFKCAHLPYYSDWIMKPAEKHFTGKLALMLGPWGGSHLSQFASMVIDNNLGYTVGMNDGGYSNTWEWTETLYFPISKKPVVEFMWNIGHTIRPNGQILEGNPAQVWDFIPVTRDNYLDYKQILLQKCEAAFDESNKAKINWSK